MSNMVLRDASASKNGFAPARRDMQLRVCAVLLSAPKNKTWRWQKKNSMPGITNCVFHLFCALVCIVLCFYDWPHSGDLVSDGSSDEKHLIFGHRVCACSSCSCVCVCVCVCACVCVCVCVCHDWLASFWRSRKQWQRWWGASSGWPSWTQRPLSLTSSCQGQTPCKKVLGHRICKKETN